MKMPEKDEIISPEQFSDMRKFTVITGTMVGLIIPLSILIGADGWRFIDSSGFTIFSQRLSIFLLFLFIGSMVLNVLRYKIIVKYPQYTIKKKKILEFILYIGWMFFTLLAGICIYIDPRYFYDPSFTGELPPSDTFFSRYLYGLYLVYSIILGIILIASLTSKFAKDYKSYKRQLYEDKTI